MLDEILLDRKQQWPGNDAALRGQIWDMGWYASLMHHVCVNKFHDRFRRHFSRFAFDSKAEIARNNDDFVNI